MDVARLAGGDDGRRVAEGLREEAPELRAGVRGGPGIDRVGEVAEKEEPEPDVPRRRRRVQRPEDPGRDGPVARRVAGEQPQDREDARLGVIMRPALERGGPVRGVAAEHGAAVQQLQARGQAGVEERAWRL